MKTLKGIGVFLGSLHTAKLVALGYLSYVVLGWLLLMLPWAHAADSISPMDALFTSTSALTTTGLATVSTGNDYSLFGQIVILLLIQLGGVGYMTFSSFVILSRGPGLPRSRAEVASVVFSLPSSFQITEFVRGVVVFTLVIETAGAGALYAIFLNHGVESPLWSAIFHSISAFCTAGFGLYDNSFESFAGDPWLNLVIIVLSYSGAIGFIVSVDYWRRFTGRTLDVTLTSKVILLTTLWLSVIGTCLLFVSEPSIRELPPAPRFLASFFQCMTALTTVGFNTVPISGISHAGVVLLLFLMVVGASPSGTGGGLKTTTFTVIYATVKAVLKGQEEVVFRGRPIPIRRIRTAFASLGLYVWCLIVGVFLLCLVENASLEVLAFEAASALGTVGLSEGVTASLTTLGKWVIIALMFVGRLGPLTFGLALFVRSLRQGDYAGRDLAV